MAVLKKIRRRWWGSDQPADAELMHPAPLPDLGDGVLEYDVRIMTTAHLDEVWRLDQRCFVDGEAYSRDTFEYLLTAPESVAYRVVVANGLMVGFVIGL